MAHTDKRIEDYLHLYIGCDVMYSNTICKLFGVHKAYYVIDFNSMMVKINFHYNAEHGKPILRPLSDMSEEEKQVIENMAKIYKGYMTLPSYELSKRWAADQTRDLLSKHFDLFNLIPEGLAIDKSKL